MIDGDHDVFGHGTVILKYAPGHTPGHQCLFVELSKTGGVLVAGDLYDYAEERTLHRMPTREQTAAAPASRASPANRKVMSNSCGYVTSAPGAGFVRRKSTHSAQ